MTAVAGSRHAATGDVLALAVVLVLVAVAGWRAAAYGLWSYGEPGPGLFPLIVCAFTGVFAVIAMVTTVASGAPAEEIDPEAAQQEGPLLWGKLGLYGVAIVAWPWMMVPLGFVLSTAIALFVVMRLAEGMRWVPLAVVL
ncbi:MAG: tripartite tricarboxylate transporter TctB family protein, partial [Alphaproteobacteria bacterium]